jgi:hypothetical protein
LVGQRPTKRVKGADADGGYAGAGGQTPGCRQSDPDADERPRSTSDGDLPNLSPTTACLRRALYLCEQGGRVPRASVGRQAERCLVQYLAAAQRADGGVGSRRVETDDPLFFGAQLSQ